MEPEEHKKQSLDPVMRELSWEVREVVEEILTERLDELSGAVRSGFENTLEHMNAVERRLQQQLNDLQVAIPADTSPQIEHMQKNIAELRRQMTEMHEMLETLPFEGSEDEKDDEYEEERDEQ